METEIMIDKFISDNCGNLPPPPDTMREEGEANVN